MFRQICGFLRKNETGFKNGAYTIRGAGPCQVAWPFRKCRGKFFHARQIGRFAEPLFSNLDHGVVGV
jgi:hypothetical protein